MPLAPALRLLAARGVPAAASRSAGRYLCNAAYHQALAGSAPTLFVHMPPRLRRARPDRPARTRPEDAFAAALVDIALRLLVQARRR